MPDPAMLQGWSAIERSLPTTVAFRRKINGMLRNNVDRHAFLPFVGLSLGEVCVFLLATSDADSAKG
jgi:hypothetical protein